MCLFNGFDMTDRDAYDEGYSYHEPYRRKRIVLTKADRRNRLMSLNALNGIWFTGERIADMTDAHIDNALALCERKGYKSYVYALKEEKFKRMYGGDAS